MEAIRAEVRRKEDGPSNNELRRRGLVPGVVYGPDVQNLPIQVDGRELDQTLRRQSTNKPLLLNINGNEQNVMVYELQRHPVMGNVLHVDFKQINMNERIHTSVPVLMTGEPELGVATLVRHSVEVRCLPTSIPEAFTVNVDGLNIGDVILVKDLEVPQGVDLELDELEVLISVLPAKAPSDESQDAAREAEAVKENAETEEAKNA